MVIHWSRFRKEVVFYERDLFLQISSVFTEQSRGCVGDVDPFTIDQGRPDTVMGQSIVLSEIKTEAPLENDDPAYRNFLLQQI